MRGNNTLQYLRSQQVVYPSKYLNIGPSHCAFDLFKFEFKIKFVRCNPPVNNVFKYCYFSLYTYSLPALPPLVCICSYNILCVMYNIYTLPIYFIFIYVHIAYNIPFSYFHLVSLPSTNLHLQKCLNVHL